MLFLLRTHLTSKADWEVKGKSVPLQAWSGPEGSRKLMFPDFVTTAQDGGKVVSLTYRPPLPPPPQEILLLLISVRGWVDLQGHSAIGRIFISIKNSIDTSCDRTSVLPICSTSPRVPQTEEYHFITLLWISLSAVSVGFFCALGMSPALVLFHQATLKKFHASLPCVCCARL